MQHVTLPTAPEAERAALGACLIDSKPLQIDPDMFSCDRHRIIATAIKALSERGIPIDLVTVWDALHNTQQIANAGGTAYLAELVEQVPNANNLSVYEQIVLRKHHERQILRTCESMVCTEQLDPAAVAAKVNTLRDASERLTQTVTQTSMLTACRNMIDKIEARMTSPETLLGLSTGISDLDAVTSGFCRSDLIVIAARAGIGKTALAGSLALNMAEQGQRVLFFSLEMALDQLLYRMISAKTGLDLLRLRSGNISTTDHARVMQTLHALSDLSVTIDDSPYLTELDIIRRSKKELPNVVFIDYLQYVRPSSQQERRDLEVAVVSRAMKALAKEMNIPVVLLAQLNRKLEERADKRPSLSDLRESGAIEMDADVVLFIYDDSSYNSRSPDAGIAELIIGKQRNGPKTTVPVAYHKHCTRFADLDPLDLREFWQRKTTARSHR